MSDIKTANGNLHIDFQGTVTRDRSRGAVTLALSTAAQRLTALRHAAEYLIAFFFILLSLGCVKANVP